MEIIKNTFTLAVNTGIGFGVGYVYGAIFNTNQALAAKAFGIATFISTLIPMIALPLKDRSPNAYWSFIILGNVTVGILQIVAFRHFKLIATLGTVIFATSTVLSTLNSYNQLKISQLNI